MTRTPYNRIGAVARHAVATTVVALLAAGTLLAGSALAGTLEEQLAATESEQDQVQEKIHASEEKEEVLTSKISEFRTRIDNLNGPIADLDARIADLEARIAAGKERIARLRLEREALTERVERLEAELQIAEQRLLDRLVDIYVAGGREAYTDALIAGGTFGQWLDRQDIVERIAEQDDAVMRSVDRLRTSVAAERERTRTLQQKTADEVAQVEADEREVAAERQVLVDRRTELEGVKAEREEYLGKIQEHQEHLHEDLEQLEKDSKSLEAAIAAGQAAVDPGTIPTGPGPSGLLWPVSGPVVSGFGPRWGRLHAGVDIAAPAGRPIYAAAGGVVTYASVMSGYGNLVIVQHGGNLSTAYAHQSVMASSVGQVVTQGQLLGYVGCTGHCYGDHLHFETRIGGAAVDPMQYF